MYPFDAWYELKLAAVSARRCRTARASQIAFDSRFRCLFHVSWVGKPRHLALSCRTSYRCMD